MGSGEGVSEGRWMPFAVFLVALALIVAVWVVSQRNDDEQRAACQLRGGHEVEVRGGRTGWVCSADLAPAVKP